MLKTAILTVSAAFLALAAMPACAEPVENGTEIAALLAQLGERCWAVDLDGLMLDAAALSDVEGPIDIEIECQIVDQPAEKKTRPLPRDVI